MEKIILQEDRNGNVRVNDEELAAKVLTEAVETGRYTSFEAFAQSLKEANAVK